MKTTIELQGYEITIEENEGMIMVSAQKDGEVVEEFELGTDEMGQDEDEDEMLPFDEEDEDFDEEDDEDMEDEDFDEEDDEDMEDEDFDEEDDEDMEEEEEEEEEDDFVKSQNLQGQAQKPQAQMESFSSFMKRRKY